MPPTRLQSAVLPRVELTFEQIERMYDLLSTHFADTDHATFLRDLDEKEWVILLKGPDGDLLGFSTLMAIETTVEGMALRAFFSGDTIIHRDHWGDPALASIWGNFVLSQVGSRPDVRTFWFLISKGFRTYRFLPVYFDRFYPRHDAPIPPLEHAILDHLATLKFPGHYDPRSGVIRFSGGKDRLTEDLAEVPEGRLSDPHVRYFLERNPGFAAGDELACLAEIHPDNLKPAARRVLRSRD